MRLAVGGAATIFVSVAVVCAVAVSNAAALADTSGARISFAQIDVPLSTPRPTPSATSTATVATPAATVTADPVASPETVPAPEPEEVAPATVATVPAADAPAVPAPGPVEAPSEESSTSSMATNRAWERLIRWAHSNGWSDAEIARWIADHRSSSEWKALWQAIQTPARGAGTPSVSDLWSDDG